MLPGVWRVFALCHVIRLKNYSRIIEPLASRCSKFRFTPLDPVSSHSRLSYIAMAEHINVNSPVIDTLISTSSGDLRRAITYLQSASRLSSSTNPPTQITPGDIQEIAGVIPDIVINDFASVLGVDTNGHMDVCGVETRKQTGFNPIKNKVKGLIREGYSASQILIQVRAICPVIFLCVDRTQLHDLIILHATLNARQKSLCAMVFAEADKALCDGADEELWILEVGLQIHKALS
jgi:replication factor C subunit 2/4